MDYFREILFAFLEEDNTQRAYFRIKPLLSASGDVQEEARKLWPDDGALRIVPDKNEQYYFKDRMREIGRFCAMDLTGFSPDANKIRTNKNYRPEQGEHHQFILFSDAIKTLPENAFHQILDGAPDDFADLAAQAVTPLFFIRQDATLFGPVSKAAPAAPSPASEAQGTLYTVHCPDDVDRDILCLEVPAAKLPEQNAAAPAKDAAPAKREAKPEKKAKVAKDKPLPLGKPLTILDASKDFEETLETIAQPLSSGANLLRGDHREPSAEELPRPALTGTPLYRGTSTRTAVPRPKNKLQEVVSSQWRAAKYEPPAEPLPAGATLRHVDNPVEDACNSMKTAWRMPETQQQLVDFLLSLPGMHQLLDARVAADANGTPLQRVLQDRLQDLEAERLSALVQLDKAKDDLDSFRTTALDALQASRVKELRSAEAAVAAHERSITALKEQINALTAQRDALLEQIDTLQHATLPDVLAKALATAQLTAPIDGIPLRMSGVCGVSISPEEAMTRLTDTCTALGITFTRSQAAVLLSLLAVCPRIGLTCPTMAPLATLCRALAAHMGWSHGLALQTTAEEKPLLTPAPVDSTPMIFLTTLPAYAPLSGATKVLLSKNTIGMTHSTAYETDPWPIWPLASLPMLPEAQPTENPAPVSAALLTQLAAAHPAKQEELMPVLSPVLSYMPPLSGRALSELTSFIGVASSLLEGGLAAACDWAIALWLVPMMDRNQRNLATMKAALAEYPTALTALQL